ncbi:hypothetical protein QE152_g1764 [Popillia japonica]|uniref:DDE-1 domain-containing protein n=1 Tax=Popillia japonica TaxID=7064 RepID=A0AAW1N5B9_POPJA
MEDPGSKRSLNVHDAIINIAAAWEAIKPETIQNWFKKAGFRNNEVDVALEKEELTKLQGFPGYASFDDNVAIRSIENLIEDVNNTQKEALRLPLMTTLQSVQSKILLKM